MKAKAVIQTAPCTDPSCEYSGMGIPHGHTVREATTRPRIALYARVSTDDQHVEAQLGPLREYAARRGVGAVEYVDRGVSGRKDRRPALDRMLEAARRREISAIVCTKLDRLARSTRHLTMLAEEFQTLGIDLVLLDSALDTGTAVGKLLYGVLSVVAEFEADLIRERTVAGLRAARRRGRRLGRPEVLDTEQRARVGRLRAAGHSHRAIADQLGCSHTTVRRALSVEQKPHRQNGHAPAATARMSGIEIQA